MEKQKTYFKKLTLGRLESSKEFKSAKKLPTKNTETEIETLKIVVRDLNEEDIKKRNLPKNSKGILIVEMSNRSPLARFLSVNDIILEVQKTAVSSETIDQFVKNIIKKGEQTLLLTILNKNNQRRYIGVKIN